MQAVYEAFRRSPGQGKMQAGGAAMIKAACQRTGVTLGAYDAQIVRWLAGFEPQACAVIAGLVARAARHADAQRPVTFDLLDGHDAYFVLSEALGEWAAQQRDKAEAEGGNESRAARVLRGRDVGVRRRYHPDPAPAPRAAGVAPAPARPQHGQPGEWKPVIPEHLRTKQGVRKAVSWQYRRARHHTLYHGMRWPARLLSTLRWAAVGIARIVFAQLGWWWVSEQAYLRHDAAAAGDTQKWLSLNKHVREVRLVRGLVLLCELVAVAAAVITSYSVLLWIPVGLVAVPLLAWIGSPTTSRS